MVGRWRAGFVNNLLVVRAANSAGEINLSSSHPGVSGFQNRKMM
jgi:hypothetical protein